MYLKNTVVQPSTAMEFMVVCKAVCDKKIRYPAVMYMGIVFSNRTELRGNVCPILRCSWNRRGK
jgi:hypothetical protein